MRHNTTDSLLWSFWRIITRRNLLGIFVWSLIRLWETCDTFDDKNPRKSSVSHTILFSFLEFSLLSVQETWGSKKNRGDCRSTVLLGVPISEDAILTSLCCKWMICTLALWGLLSLETQKEHSLRKLGWVGGVRKQRKRISVADLHFTE